MTTKLTDMTIDEISLVDDPANGEARVMIVKAKNPKNPMAGTDAEMSEMDEDMPDDEEAEAKPKPKKKMQAPLPYENMDDRLLKFRDALEDAELTDEQTDAVEKAAEELVAFAVTATETASAAKEKTMDLEQLSKALGEAEAKLAALEKRADEADAALAEANEIIKEKDVELSSVRKSAGEGEDEVLKSLPEAIRKRLEDAEAEIAKVRAENEEREAVAKAKSLGVGEPDKVGPLLLRVEKGMTTADDAKVLTALLKGVGEIAVKSALFKALGSAASEEGSPEEQLQAKADEIAKSNPKLTKEQAYAEAMKQNPQLYNQYVAKRRA